MSKKPEVKEFGLKPIEVQLINTIQQAVMSNTISYIALERLAYQVTINTKFEIQGDKLRIWEEDATETPPTSVADAVKGDE